MRYAVLVSILAVLSAHSAVAQEGRVRRASRPVRDQYIVVLAAADDPEAVGREAEVLHRGRLKHVYRHALRGFAIRLSSSAAAALARDPRVRLVEEDGVVTASDTQVGPPWGLDRIDQRQRPLDGLFNFRSSTSVVYAHVIDTGIRPTHQDFGARASIAGDFVDDDEDDDPLDIADDDGIAGPDGADCNGHGTHVAGTIAGQTYGVAKQATVLAYRVLNCAGDGTWSGVIAGVDAVTADGRRPAVANMSLGGGISEAVDQAVRQSIAAGITYVIAAGNENIDASNKTPARVAEAITVGATTSSDARASFSNFGPLLDLFAPGTGVWSAWYTSDTAAASLSGTSMASPHVAGVAALYLQHYGHTSPLALRNAIVGAATTGLVTGGGLGSPNLLLYSDVRSAADTLINVAAAGNGGVASASSVYGSGYAPGGAINGDRRGLNWGAGGGWADSTSNTFPDWLEVAFSGSSTITQVDVFGVQDNYKTPVEPTQTMTFTKYGLTAFEVQYWTGSAWAAVPGGTVSSNSLIWRTITFAPISTTKIRVVVNSALASWSRIAEVEVLGTAPVPPPPPPPPPPDTLVNVALASNGGLAQASSVHSAPYVPAGANNGDRKGVAYWADGTSNIFPDWLEVSFSSTVSLKKVNVFSVQDNYKAPVEPTDTMTFTKYGLRDFEVQYWNGAAWVTVPGGAVTGNNRVWRTFTFDPVTTDKIRILVGYALGTWSRAAEVEALAEVP